jgi:hypothetical protein
MSRLDTHILIVRNKLMLSLFLRAAAWSASIFLGVVWLTIILERVLDRSLRHERALFWIGLGISALVAGIYSFARRPTRQAAAVAIDDSLKLKEKYSTALYVRESRNPFAQAVVQDAEYSSQNVSLHNQFPVRFPRPAYLTATILAGAILTSVFLPTFHSTAKAESAAAALVPKAATNKLDSKLLQQLPKIEQGDKLATDNDAIHRATNDLTKALQSKDGDELHTKRSALSALQNYNKAMLEELSKNEKFQTAINTKNELSQMASAKDDSTPLGKAQNELKSGDLDSAMKDVARAVDDFQKVKPEDQEKAVEQAQALAQELNKAATDPHVQEKLAQQMQQMGATQQQAQQMAAAMQQAAQGNKSAAQQLQQMAQQAQQQMNNGKGPTQQQQQQIQKMMAQAQGIASSQAQAQALAQAAKQLAGAMAQAKGGGQQGQANGQQQAQQGQNGQSMAQAQQAMQQQLGQMQAQAKDAQAMKAAADAAAQAASDSAAGLNGSGEDGQQMSQGNGQGQNQGQGNQPNGNPGNGAGGGVAKGGGKNSTGMNESPYQTQQEVDPSKDIETGKILASRYVKAGIDPGKSIAGLHNVASAELKDAPDEVEQDHVSRDAQQSVKEYFSAMQKQSDQ